MPDKNMRNCSIQARLNKMLADVEVGKPAKWSLLASQNNMRSKGESTVHACALRRCRDTLNCVTYVFSSNSG